MHCQSTSGKARAFLHMLMEHLLLTMEGKVAWVVHGEELGVGRLWMVVVVDRQGWFMWDPIPLATTHSPNHILFLEITTANPRRPRVQS